MVELSTHLPTLFDNVDYFVELHFHQLVMTFRENVTVFTTLVATVGDMKLKAKEIHDIKIYLLPQEEVILLPQEPVFEPQEAVFVPHEDTLLPQEATLLPQLESMVWSISPFITACAVVRGEYFFIFSCFEGEYFKCRYKIITL